MGDRRLLSRRPGVLTPEREPSTLAVVLAVLLMVAGLAALIYGFIEAALWIGQWA